MSTTEKVMWLAIGAAIGAGIALLYAPKTGKDTRKYLKRKAEDARETLVETGETIRDASKDVYNAGRDVYKKGVGLATDAAESAAGLWDRGRKTARG